MKKTVKIFISVALVLALSLSLCSCVDLDAIKNTRVSYIGENQTRVKFQGNTYKQLDKNISDYLYTYEIPETGYAVKEDVPLLLTQSLGKWVSFNSTDTRIIQIEETYYCREDIYDYATKLIEKNEFEYPCFMNYDYKTGESTIKMLDKKILDVVDEVIHNTAPLSKSPDDENRTLMWATVLTTDKEALFVHDLFDVEKLTDGSYLITMANLADDIYGYIVPKVHANLFEPLFEEQMKYEQSEDFEDEDDFQIYF